MNYEEIRDLSRVYCPQAKTNVISNSRRDLIIKEGVIDVARLTICLPTNEKFDVVADQREYNLSTEVTRFLVIAKSGLWWHDGSNYKQLSGVTIEWLDEHIPLWRDMDSGDPIYYYQEGDTLGIYPTPDTAYTNGFWLYFGQKPLPMTDDAHYPFGYDTEISRLSILSEAILLYWRWKALRGVGKGGNQSILIAKKDYVEEIALRIKQLKSRKDISASRKTRLKGRRISRPC